jgi:hypothetical protein
VVNENEAQSCCTLGGLVRSLVRVSGHTESAQVYELLIMMDKKQAMNLLLGVPVLLRSSLRSGCVRLSIAGEEECSIEDERTTASTRWNAPSRNLREVLRDGRPRENANSHQRSAPAGPDASFGGGIGN